MPYTTPDATTPTPTSPSTRLLSQGIADESVLVAMPEMVRSEADEGGDGDGGDGVNTAMTY